MNTLSKIASTHPHATSQKKDDLLNSPAMSPANSKTQKETVPPALSTSALAVPGNADNANLGLSEQQLKRQGLESLVAVLKSLVTWGTVAGKNLNTADSAQDSVVPVSSSQASSAEGMVSDSSLDKLAAPTSAGDLSRTPTPEISDDPGRFESAKQRKTILQEGIKRFNYKPKKGIEFLLDNGFIPSREPVDISKFLLSTDGLSKATIGEYLGEGCVYFCLSFRKTL